MTNQLRSKRSFPDELFDDQDLTGSALLAAAYAAQVAYFLPFELPAYYASARWMAAQSVLDAGTGNGSYLRALASVFRDKSYRGIDVAPHQIQAAMNQPAQNIQFACADLFLEEGSYDAMIMRLLVQHLPDTRAVLEKSIRLVNPGGSVFIIDGFEKRTFYVPRLAAYDELMTQLRLQRSATGVDIDIMASLEASVDWDLWEIGDVIEQIVPTSVAGNKELLVRMQEAILDYLEHIDMFHLDFEKIRSEWQDWYADRDSYGQECLKIVRLDRRT